MPCPMMRPNGSRSAPGKRPDVGSRSDLAGKGIAACAAYHAPNNSLERTQPQRGFMYDVAELRRSAPCR
jgi:hypothetical protein